MATVERTVFPLLLRFYDAAGDLVATKDVQTVLASKPPTERLHRRNGYDLLFRIHQSAGKHWECSFSNIKQKDLPNARNRQDKARQIILLPDEGLDYVSHLTVTSTGKEAFVLYERPYQGPAWKTLERYLNILLKDDGIRCELSFLIPTDAWKKLKKAPSIVSLTARVRGQERKSLAEFFGASFDGVRVAEVKIAGTRRKPFNVTSEMVERLAELQTDPGETAKLEYEDLDGKVWSLLGDKQSYTIEVDVMAGTRSTPGTDNVFKSLRKLLGEVGTRLAELTRKGG